MRDLSSLLESVRDRDARVLFNEALRAYQAGANRASIVSIWIAVTSDLITKVRHLAEQGDGAAAAAMRDVHAFVEGRDVRKMQAFENGLLELCADKLQLLTAREKSELTRLYEDRNLCAHPGYEEGAESFHPTAELVRSHLAMACDAVLSQPGIAGRQMIATFLTELESDSWSEDDVASYLRTRYFERSRDQVKRNLSEIFVKGCIEPPKGDNNLAFRCLQCVRALHEFDHDRFDLAVESVLSKREQGGQLGDKDLLRAVGALGPFDAMWKRLPSTSRMRLIALLKVAPLGSLVEERFFASGPPSDIEVRDLYNGILDRAGIDEVDNQLNRPYDRGQWADKALTFLAESSNYRVAEANMRRVLKTTEAFQLRHVETFAETILHNDQVRVASDMPALALKALEDTVKIVGARQVWVDLAAELKARNRADPSGSSSYYSYDGLSGFLAT
ncbi:hypothetical protein [Cryobacterium sp. Y11]|uniref:hypothetical protein n=1 Tax=Cryobacterium sp. Y11 TaxID=2045016 RepID=UPI000CE566B0|nr:hypothetical protein [Cryobacterium sp. Y11]